MTDDLITLTAGAPQTDNRPRRLRRDPHRDQRAPTILRRAGVNAGKEVTLRDWTFALEDGTEIRGSASIASGPRARRFAWLTALLGGAPPVIGQSYPRSQLVGRMALATIPSTRRWAKIVNLSALPTSNGATARPGRPRRRRRPPPLLPRSGPGAGDSRAPVDGAARGPAVAAATGNDVPF